SRARYSPAGRSWPSNAYACSPAPSRPSARSATSRPSASSTLSRTADAAASANPTVLRPPDGFGYTASRPGDVTAEAAGATTASASKNAPSEVSSTGPSARAATAAPAAPFSNVKASEASTPEGYSPTLRVRVYVPDGAAAGTRRRRARWAEPPAGSVTERGPATGP